MSRLANDLAQVNRPEDWNIENERLEYLRQLERSISNWEGQPPNLLDVFRAEEIECLLSDCVKNFSEEGSCYRAFVEFVARSGYKDEPEVDEDGKPFLVLRRTTPIHHAAKRSIDLAAVVRQLFQIYMCDANYIDETGSTHFHVAVQFGCDDVVKKFLKLGQDPNLTVPRTHDSPLHVAVVFGRRKVAEMLVRSGAKPTLVNAKGLTPVDIVCNGHRDDVDLVKLMFKFGNEKYPLWLIHGSLKSAVSNGLVDLTKVLLKRCADPDFESRFSRNFYKGWINESTSVFKKFHDDNLPEIVSKIIDVQERELLHKALYGGMRKKVELLLRRGANPNSADACGKTALHAVCKRDDDDDLIKAFFEICDEIGQTVRLDARDKEGHTALHQAVRWGRQKTAELLVTRGADPNLAHRKGLTLLHDICHRSCSFEFPEMWFEIDERTQRRRVQVDARDDFGNTPLHLALRHHEKAMAELLLRNGADPNLMDAFGSTALHLICKHHDEKLAELFFEICDGNRQFVQIDARDKLGRTPLQWAVASIKPLVVNLLLYRGAEMSRFVFPTLDEHPTYYGAGFDPKINYTSASKLKIASRALLEIEILESAGYELDLSDALTVMIFFVQHRLFGEQDLEKCWYDDEEVVHATKEHEISNNLSLYDLIRMRPEEAETVLLFEAVNHYWTICGLPKSYSQACHMHLCEKMSRRFFRSWALVSFMELINYRLPLECCEIIIDESFTNRELYRICSAASIPS